jgi:small membrane protein
MTQPMIKILLLAALAVVGYFAVRGSRRAIHRVVWRAFVVIALSAAVLSILFPNALTWVANEVGVGRGADLLLYVLTLSFMLVSVVLFRRLADLERKYVALARTMAVRETQDQQDRRWPDASASTSSAEQA